MTVPSTPSNNDLWRLLVTGAGHAYAPSGKTDLEYAKQVASVTGDKTMNDVLRVWVGSSAKPGDDNRTLLQRKLILNGGSYKPGATENDLLRALVSLL